MQFLVAPHDKPSAIARAKARVRARRARIQSWFWRQAWKIVIAVTGFTIILAGILMLVFPGPGWVTIFAGLALLGTEFAWARWVLKHAKTRVVQVWEATKTYTGMSPQETTNAPAPQSASSSRAVDSQDHHLPESVSRKPQQTPVLSPPLKRS